MKIDRVKIRNFKSLRDIDITLSNLTLLTGVNSSGKSSFIQALLLLKENEDNLILFGRFNNLQKPLTLITNGKYIKLGNKDDILYKDSYKENIDITLFSNNNVVIDVIFNNQDLKIDSKTNVPFVMDGEVYLTCNIFANSFQYIMTDRIAPSITYGLSDEDIEHNLIGIKGEYTAHYLNVNKNNKIFLDKLKHPKAVTDKFIENVSFWLSEISEGIEISTKIYPELGRVSLIYNYRYEDKKITHIPLNIGFGVTYVLPIIVAILKAKEGDLLILENPESHLHPAGQSKIAELCAIASANGVQIIVETHSDHFLNGIRVATKSKKNPLKSEQSQIYYFKKEKDELETQIEELNINSEGKLDKWPKDFFDQYENNMIELL